MNKVPFYLNYLCPLCRWGPVVSET